MNQTIEMKNKILISGFLTITFLLFISSCNVPSVKKSENKEKHKTDNEITSSRIIDHNCTKLGSIPALAINNAKVSLHIAYGHTSHGSQLIDGMTGLAGWKGSLYDWNDGVLAGHLDIDDYFVSGDLGNPDFTTWAALTRTYLEDPANNNVNVVIWSWCGEVSGASASNINTYLGLMSGLEKDYPGITFVYMTGHLDGTGLSGNLHLRNNQIRSYCATNNKWLFDFEDIESYDPDGVYYGDRYPNDDCYYDSNGDGAPESDDSSNWAMTWQNTHLENAAWYNCGAQHSQPLNANQKAYSAWWLWSLIAGWNGN